MDVLRTAPAAATVPTNFQQQVAALHQQIAALQQQRTQQQQPQQQQPQQQYMPNLLNMMGLPPQVEKNVFKGVFSVHPTSKYMCQAAKSFNFFIFYATPRFFKSISANFSCKKKNLIPFPPPQIFTQTLLRGHCDHFLF